MLSAKVATGPRNHHGVQDVREVNTLFNFYPLIDENQMSPTGGVTSDPSNHGLWMLAVLDDSRRIGKIGAPAPVVLMNVGLFDGE